MKKIYIIGSMLMIVLFLFSGCSEQSGQVSEEVSPTMPADTPAQPGSAVMDLTVPPPGSPASAEKWAGFSEEKKTEAWEKYISDNSADQTGQTDQETSAAVEETAPVKKPGSRGGGPVPVVVGQLNRAVIDVFYYGLGELIAGDEIRANPATAGNVASLYVKEGDFVEPGDLLFSLDSNDLVQNIERASAKWDTELELAQIRLSEARENYEVNSSLYSKQLIAKSEFDKAEQTWEEASLNYEKTRLAKAAEIENLQENLRTTVALSPGRGYVSGISFRRGEQVNSADFIEIIDIEKTVISVRVPENIITRVKEGQVVKAKQASAPEYFLEGAVIGLGLKADANRTYEVLAEFDNPSQRLLPGMLMEAQIQLIQHRSNMVVPKESVITDGGGQYVFRVSNTVAERVPVETGQSRGRLIQISGALQTGDLIVIEGQTYLQNGQSVNVTDTKEYIPETTEL